MKLFSVICAGLLMSAVGFWGLSVTALAQAPSHSFAIQDVRVFDGIAVHARVTVVVADGFIQSVGDDPVPDGFEVVDGSGQTLLPGLIDAHTHYSEPLLRQALSFGVTTVLNMSGPAAGDLRREQASGQGTDRADVFSADRMASPSASSGLSAFVFRLLAGLSGSGVYGTSVITSIDEAAAFVAARIAEGSDYIKIVYGADGNDGDGGTLPILKAVIDTAHRGGRLAVAHVIEQRAAIEAVEAGADGLVHIFGDEEPDPSFAELVAERRAFVVPTLFIYDPVSAFPYPAPSLSGDWLQHAAAAVRQLRNQGVPILAGSDGLHPGVYPAGLVLVCVARPETGPILRAPGVRSGSGGKDPPRRSHVVHR